MIKILQDLTDKDVEFIKNLKKKKKISQKEFDALLAEHLATTAALRKQRKNAATRSDELLKAKLRSRSGHGEDYIEEDEETHAVNSHFCLSIEMCRNYIIPRV